MQEKNYESVYRFVDKVSGMEYSADQIYYEGEQLKAGDVVERRVADAKTIYLSVAEVDEGEVTTVYLVRARNNTWKMAMLAGTLVASWYIIDFLFDFLFKS